MSIPDLDLGRLGGTGGRLFGLRETRHADAAADFAQVQRLDAALAQSAAHGIE